MTGKLTRYILETGIKLGEFRNVKDEVQILKACTFYDQRYGEVTITRKMLSDMVNNYHAGVRRIQIGIDYGHKSDEENAAIITDLYTREDDGELWGKVQWTPDAEQQLSERRWLYLSADFNTNYRDNETPGIDHGPVLLGAGLTNRPVIKGMDSVIVLSETKGNNMSGKNDKDKPTTELEIKLNEQLEAKEGELKEATTQLEEADGGLKQILQALGVENVQEALAKIAEKERGDDMSLSEENKDKYEKQLSEQSAEIKTLKESIEKNEKKDAFNALLSEGKACEAQRESFMKGDMAEFAKNAEVVKLTEDGDNGNSDDNNNDDGNEVVDVEAKVLELADAKVKENEGMSKRDAISLVLSENKDLKEKYEEFYG